MHEFWTISTTKIANTRSENHANTVVRKHGTQTFKVVIVVFLLCYCCLMFCPSKCTSFIIFGQVICPNILNVS